MQDVQTSRAQADSPFANEPGLLSEVKPRLMASPNYRLLVWAYIAGQIRIQLWKAADWNGAVRELCTYKPETARRVIADLMASKDPEAYCRSLENEYNCEGPGERIRLDQDSTTTLYPIWRHPHKRAGDA